MKASVVLSYFVEEDYVDDVFFSVRHARNDVEEN